MSSDIDPATTTEGLPDPGVQQAEPQEDAQTQGQPTLQDQVRGNPDFAWDQVTKRDGKISELSNRMKQYESIDPYLQAAGGPDQLLNLAAFGQQVQQVPGLADFVQKSLSEGRVALPEPEPAQQNDPAEEWLDEDLKNVRDEARGQIESLQKQLAELQQIATSASVRSLGTHVRTNMDAALSIFDNVPEAKAEALDLIESRVKVAQQQAESGNAQQQQLIDQLASPGGEKILKFMLLEEGILEKHAPNIWGKQTPTEGEGEVVVKATDGRTVNPSRPGAPPLKPLQKGARVTPNVAMEIYKEAQRRRGVAI